MSSVVFPGGHTSTASPGGASFPLSITTDCCLLPKYIWEGSHLKLVPSAPWEQQGWWPGTAPLLTEALLQHLPKSRAILASNSQMRWPRCGLQGSRRPLPNPPPGPWGRRSRSLEVPICSLLTDLPLPLHVHPNRNAWGEKPSVFWEVTHECNSVNPEYISATHLQDCSVKKMIVKARTYKNKPLSIN